MKRIRKWFLAAAFVVLALVQTKDVQAAAAGTIEKGVFIGGIDVAGKTVEEAKQTIEQYIEQLKQLSVTLQGEDETEVTVTVGDLGFKWTNPEVVEEAAIIGKNGNVVQRYKAMQDLSHQNKNFDLKYDLDKDLIRQILSEQCSAFNIEAKDATLIRTGDGFSVTPGQSGRVIDENASVEEIYNYFLNEWNYDNAVLKLVIIVDEPRGAEEDLSKVKDVLGTFSTNFKSSGSSRSANVTNGCDLVAGSLLYPGDEFSMYDAVAPFSEANGYYMAGSYLNGQVVDSLGGGICQVSTTLYNAVLLAELDVTERHNHSMIVSYVDPSADAAISESAGKDFRFVNNTDYPVYIDGHVSEKTITFTIYGAESRKASHKVSYESEVLSVTNPDTEVIYADPAIPLGQVSVQSAHIGYKARLWKIVTEDGVEVSREQINSSSYKMVPRSATVGVSTNDVNAYNEMMAAIATNSIDHVKNVAAAFAAAQAAQAAAAPPVQQPAPAPAEEAGFVE